MRKSSLLLLAILVAGCNRIPSVPYVEPPPSKDTARVRVITNADVYGDSIPTNCAPRPRHKMAESGRQYKDGRPHETWAQYPLQTRKVEGMPLRTAPKLINLMPTIRMAEGMYVEVATEYLVPTNAPFQIATLGATSGGYGSSTSVCPAQAKVFDLKPGKDYEVIVGMTPAQTPEGEQLICVFKVRELMPINSRGLALPFPVEPKPAPRGWCKD